MVFEHQNFAGYFLCLVAIKMGHTIVPFGSTASRKEAKIRIQPSEINRASALIEE